MGIASLKFVDNPKNRCPVILTLFTSASMAGKTIHFLSAGIARFKFDIEQDPLAALHAEMAIVVFGQQPEVFQDWVHD